MSSTRLIHISPELPSTVGGVADYTEILSHQLVEVSNGSLELVLVHAGKESAESIDVDFPVVDQSGYRSASTLADTVRKLACGSGGQAVVLLEYSGYGYAKRGAPHWLARGLERVCRNGEIPLVTMFHELYATGPLWSSSFWFSFAQAQIAKRLAQMSRTVITNRNGSAEQLREWLPEEIPLWVQPVFSNVGEPNELPDFKQRDPYAVVFGGQDMKRQLYSGLHEHFVRELSSVGVEKIVEVGSKSSAPKILYGMPIERYGIQPAPTVSDIFLKARAGLLHYPVDYLTKSGVWSSYAAHGVPSFVLSSTDSSVEVEEGKHYIRISREGLNYFPNKRLRDIGIKVWKWYNKNATSSDAASKVYEIVKNL